MCAILDSNQIQNCNLKFTHTKVTCKDTAISIKHQTQFSLSLKLCSNRQEVSIQKIIITENNGEKIITEINGEKIITENNGENIITENNGEKMCNNMHG
jgi:hypothetical protein